MPNTKVQQGIDLIDAMSDDELNQLVDYIRATFKLRKNKRDAKARAQLEVGCRVRIKGPTKPQYLAGMTAEVVEFRQTRVKLKLDAGTVGKFRGGIVIASPGMLEVIS